MVLEPKMPMSEPLLFREADNPPTPLVRKKERTRSSSVRIDTGRGVLVGRHDRYDDEGIHRELIRPLFPRASLLPPQPFPVLERLVDLGGGG